MLREQTSQRDQYTISAGEGALHVRGNVLRDLDMGEGWGVSEGTYRKVERAPVGALPSEGRERKKVIVEVGDVLYVRNFEDVRVSTMTLVAFIEGHVKDLDPLYFLLPVRHLTRPRLPQLTSGTITSVRHKGCYRGEPGSCFKNAVIINIISGEKKISTKLSTCKIQMCGPRSVQMGKDAANFIANHVNESVDFIARIAAEEANYRTALEWLCRHAEGEAAVTYLPFEMSSRVLLRPQQDRRIEWPTIEPPPELQYFVQQLMARCDDHDYLSELRATGEYYATIVGALISERLSISKVGRAMVNYNYQLGFCVDQLKLMQLLKDNDIGVDYPNTARAHVTVEIYGPKIQDPEVVRRDENCNKQVILIYFSGNVMQTGPGGDFMEQYYYRVVELIARHRDEVISVDDDESEPSSLGSSGAQDDDVHLHLEMSP